MLNQLRIQNFKGWKDSGLIRTAPLTLFFGTNSSGKSSIGQFLMMLKQTIDSPDRKAVFFPGGKNTAVQLGSFREMVYQRNPENRISFEYQWGFKDAISFKDPISEKSYFGDALNFEAEVGLISKEQLSVSLNKFKYMLFHKENIPYRLGWNE